MPRRRDPGPWAIAGVVLAIVLAGSPAATGASDGEPPSEVVFTSRFGDVSFPHALHHDDLGIECESCHHDTAAGALELPHPEYFQDFWIECESCHRTAATAAETLACGACHHSAPADIADETLSSKVVLHESCWECHPAGTGSEASAACATCHQPAPDAAGKRGGSK